MDAGEEPGSARSIITNTTVQQMGQGRDMKHKRAAADQFILLPFRAMRTQGKRGVRESDHNTEKL